MTVLPQTIHLLADRLLASADPATLLPDVLSQIPTLRETVPLSTRAEEAYSRRVLLADQRGEVLLMAWRADQFCAPHDHASATGFVLLLHGEFEERQYQWRNGSLHPVGSQTAQAPAFIPFEHGRIHDMKASTGGLSLHVYTPCIHGMRVYDMDSRRTLIVDDTCGAWVPRERKLILKEMPWNE